MLETAGRQAQSTTVAGAAGAVPALPRFREARMIRRALVVCLVVLLPMAASGCVLAIGATAGAIAGSELEERDGRFDPFENTEVGRAIYD